MLVTQENMSSLKYSIKLFANKGLTRFTGESVTIAKKQLIVACTRLSDVGQLPQDTLKDVLTGLSKCSCESFRKVFDHLPCGKSLYLARPSYVVSRRSSSEL